nr:MULTISPECIES: type II toxin-antitoxin system HicA family toxin [unclassified Ensifer]
MLAELASITMFASMNGKQKKTLVAVFKDPVSGTIEWAGIENLLVAAGANVIERNGSRVKFEKDGIIASFHRPHPDKEAKRYQVCDAREFLTQIGVEP